MQISSASHTYMFQSVAAVAPRGEHNAPTPEPVVAANETIQTVSTEPQQTGAKQRVEGGTESQQIGTQGGEEAKAATSEETGVTIGSPERSVSGQELTQDQLRELEQLKSRDREVRAHEMAHLAAGAGLVRGGMSFTYQNGPDGQRYAVGGEVSIDTSKVAGDPQATLQKARQIQAAAMAPANPSAQDRSVAAGAAQMAAEARMELVRMQGETLQAETVPSPVNEGEENEEQDADTTAQTRTRQQAVAAYSQGDASPSPGSMLSVAA